MLTIRYDVMRNIEILPGHISSIMILLVDNMNEMTCCD